MIAKNFIKFNFVLAIFCLKISVKESSSQNISSIVGYTGYSSYGWNSDGGPATSSQVDNSTAVSVDASGNIYLVDGGTSSRVRIRKINTAGKISTIAGPTDGGTAVYSATTGVAPITVRYQTPLYDVTVDGSGDIYFVERDRIRKITTSTNIVSIVAGSNLSSGASAGDGGSATAATVRFNRMSSIAVDGSGNIYIVDRGNHRVRKVTFSTGLLSTVAGTGTAGYNGDGIAATSAQLNFPHGVAVDAAGNVYIGDRDNNRIRKITVSTGIITTVAGNGTAGYAGDAGAATAANINLPTGVAIDASNNIYITDQNNQCIRKVTVATGIISTVAGTGGSAGYSGDGGSATSAQLSFPAGTIGTAGVTINLDIDAAGNIYIPDYSNFRLRKVEASTGIISTIAGTGTQGYIANGGPSTSAQLQFPKTLSLSSSSGNLYIGTNAQAEVKKVNSSGVITTIAGTGVASITGVEGDGGQATAALISSSTDGVAVDPSGNIYILQAAFANIRKVDGATGIITTVVGTGTAGYNGDGILATAAKINPDGTDVVGIVTDASGNIYFSDSFNNRVRKITVSTGIITTVAGNGTAGSGGDGGAATAANLNWPCQIALDASDNIYIADANNNRIRKVMISTGVITTVAGNGTAGFGGDGGAATAANLNSPRGVAVDAATGDIYIADDVNQRIRKVTASTGIISTFVGTGTAGYNGDGIAAITAQLNGPSGLAAGNGLSCLYVADWANNRVRTVGTGGSCITILPVELYTFNVSCNGADVNCNWSTASESNNDYFAIERSSDGKTWSVAGAVKGAGNSSGIRNYSFTDSELPPSGEAAVPYYRLKQIDFDGNYEYFGPISALCSLKNDWDLSIRTITVDQTISGTLFAAQDAELILQIIDIQGRVIKQEKINVSQGVNYFNIELDNVGAGMYFIGLQNEKVKLHRKFIVH